MQCPLTIYRYWYIILLGYESLEWIRRNVRGGTYEISDHAFDECEDENITDDDLEEVLLKGEILEQYEERRDPRGDSCLILGRPEKWDMSMWSWPNVVLAMKCVSSQRICQNRRNGLT